MKYYIENQTSCKITICIEIESDEIEKEKNRLFRKYARQISIPGFRKGKAPLGMIKRRIGDEIEEEAISALFNSSYENATKKLDVWAIGEPTVKIEKYEQGSPLICRVYTDTKSVFELNKYKGYDVRMPELVVNEEHVEIKLKEISKDFSKFVSVEEPAQEGDRVIAEFLPKSKNETDEDLSLDKRLLLEFVLEEDGVHAEYYDLLIGSEVASDLEFEIEFSSKFEEFCDRDMLEELDLWDESILCEVTIVDIKRKMVVELTDDFVSEEIEGAETVLELREEIKTNTKLGFQKGVEKTLFIMLMSKILDDNPFDVSEHLVEKFLAEDVEKKRDNSEFIEDIEKYKAQLYPQVIKQLKISLIQDKLIDLLDVEITKEDVKQKILGDPHISEILTTYENLMGAEKYPEFYENVKDSVRSNLKFDRLLKKLLELQTIELVPVTREDIEEKGIDPESLIRIVDPSEEKVLQQIVHAEDELDSQKTDDVDQDIREVTDVQRENLER
ncbi:MAG: trigger factor [Candidatus Cloacimonetes bacterium 4572_55]|nr:MAG: trigger factor [Candidatus Cloacimonetes bacterium 4572_55]